MYMYLCEGRWSYALAMHCARFSGKLLLEVVAVQCALFSCPFPYFTYIKLCLLRTPMSLPTKQQLKTEPNTLLTKNKQITVN